MALLRSALAASGDGLSLAQAQAQLAGLSRLHHRLARASGGDLAGLRGEITASVAATQLFLQNARAESAAAEASQTALREADRAARASVANFMDDYYGKKEFEPYLRFSSAEDEAAFRKREEERHREIEAALAEGTPEGALRASQLSVEQLEDAGAHGADKSAKYAPTLQGLTKARDDLAARLPGQKQTPPKQQDVAAPGQEAEDAPLDPAAIAALRSAGVAVADQDATGHGVTARSSAQTASGRRA